MQLDCGSRRRVEARRDAFRSDDHQLAGLDLALVGGADQIEGAGFGGKHDRVLPLSFEARNSSHRQRTEAARIARRKDPVRAEHHQRKRAFDAAQRIGHRVRQSLFLGVRDQVNDDFGVAVGLEDRALGLQAMPDFLRVHQVAVVGQRNHALVRLHHDGLRIEAEPNRRRWSSGCARWPASRAAGDSTSSVKMSATSPMARWACKVRPLEVTMPADSWPRCCSACSPR